MLQQISEYRLFLREFVQTFHTTGAILPSGRSLANALVRYVREPTSNFKLQTSNSPLPTAHCPLSTSLPSRRILEVGPGTGAVTRRLIAAMGPEDRLDLVELNDRFVARLREQLATDPQFQSVAARSQIFHCSVEDLPQERQYDLVISGLPLNNFSAELVERIVQVLTGVIAPAGTLSFFEYIAVRRARSLISGRKERARLHGIGRVLAELLQKEIHRDWVWPNVPPAWVHHIRF